jgi:arylsulfatase A-like enzyme
MRASAPRAISAARATRRPRNVWPLARTLKLNGYTTAQFGKCHEVPVWETSPAGPFDAWPTGGGGFEYFYWIGQQEAIRIAMARQQQGAHGGGQRGDPLRRRSC